ncbi:hypothetical protein JV46_00900 [Solemya velum gill symbiont]|uniref:Uncharacterized protein n=1 Tax=Solemya velum gill symbiont TaxID=2340 RepID=A0A0B0H7Z7_SOVGS|nr:hypothetical protein JV46_00900 [Solemya velum gill symbiont]
MTGEVVFILYFFTRREKKYVHLVLIQQPRILHKAFRM